MYNLIDGNLISKNILSELQKELDEVKMFGKKIVLADIQVGLDDASSVYVANKIKKFEQVGIIFKPYKLSKDITEVELLNLIEKLNDDNDINAIFVELPLPKHINEKNVINKINPKKDVDGFNVSNIGALLEEQEGFYPCTAEGIVELLMRNNIEIEGKHCVIVGRSNIVGKPVAILMLNKNATITICHSKTRNLKEMCKTADILIVAIGKPKFINEEYIKKDAVVVDVGIHSEFVDGKKIVCGDVDFEKVAPLASYITPVPGGVGPITIAMLVKHCILTIKNEKV